MGGALNVLDMSILLVFFRGNINSDPNSNSCPLKRAGHAPQIKLFQCEFTETGSNSY